MTNNTKTLASTLMRGNNNFDLVRLLAATGVMVSHSFALRTGAGREWGLLFTGRETIGSMAVFAFFLISGMLVTASFIKQRSALRFAASRALRIWPGAIVCALFIAFVVGPVFYNGTLTSYFANATMHRWLLHNATLLGGVMGFDGVLPGVFPHNRIPGFVSGTIWSLPVELECYVMVLALGLLGVLKSRTATAVAIGLLAFVFFHIAKQPPTHLTLAGFFILPPGYSLYPVPFFMLGMLLYTYRDRIVLHWLPAMVLIALYVANRHDVDGALLLYPAFVYAVLWFSSLRSLQRLRPRHDYSYGIYLYGFVVQQAVEDLFPAWNNFENVALAIPIAAVLAAFSWHFIERPCLAWVRRNERIDRPDALQAYAGQSAPIQS
ncbi:MAG TPA: acyltransferase [Dyella sp.]|uniref:acyltransferase family protein n=1 Tax=Dyella sp. TaxID=1869338 RepID=UPI002C88A0DB|nr:acyltransferase [Dyella sp.]HTV85446.1 acyltransferase [Dyella sp.]